MRRLKTKLMLLALVAMALLGGYVPKNFAAAAVDDLVNAHWKGASSLTPVNAAPNPTRCGPFPENIELTFTGSGIDTDGGIFNSAASACTNTTTGAIFDLKSTDTYVQSGDAVFIETEAFTPVLNPATCVSTNSHPVVFRVAGGTGAYAGATGQGTFHIATNDIACNGIAQPARVWFQGVIQRAQ